jgi:hypothetical protein
VHFICRTGVVLLLFPLLGYTLDVPPTNDLAVDSRSCTSCAGLSCATPQRHR